MVTFPPWRRQVYAMAREAEAGDRQVIPNMKTLIAELSAGVDHSTIPYQ